uniref:Uncharacterized protein n=1 Tax=Borely moumouvirus TaxID=2712067 RepID=A0A6G6ABZ9_9VIRU
MSIINDFHIFHNLGICITNVLKSQNIKLMKEYVDRFNLKIEAQKIDKQLDDLLEYLDKECDEDIIEELLNN